MSGQNSIESSWGSSLRVATISAWVCFKVLKPASIPLVADAVNLITKVFEALECFGDIWYHLDVLVFGVVVGNGESFSVFGAG